MWKKANPNPCRTEEPDCVVRAIAIVTRKKWDRVHYELCEMSRRYCTMPSVNWLWGMYLEMNGFEKFIVDAPVTVREFSLSVRFGDCVACTGTHAVAIRNGNYLDAWDSGDEIVSFYYWRRK